MDLIYIHGLQIETVIGELNWEQAIKQKVRLDIDLGTDNSTVSKSDDLVDTPDYAAISTRLKEFISSGKFNLIETLAEKAAQLILEEFKVPWVRINVCKPGAARGAKEVGTIIERSNH